VAVSASGDVYVSDNNAYCRIEKFTSTGTYVTQWGSCYVNNPNTQDCGIWSIAVGPDGNVYAADAGCNMVKAFTGSGSLVFRSTTTLGSFCSQGFFSTPYGVAVDALGNLYVADTGSGCIQKFGPGGTTPARSASWGSLKMLYH
jgi:DNA-binding beta-propeller fold protein YncE